jgi:biopolymer transport protein ExbD
MAFGAHGGGGRLKADINVTPLVDVVLVLLIIFMVITPMLTRGRTVDLPTAAATDEGELVKDPVVLTVSSDKSLWIETQRVKLDTLTVELAKRLQENPAREVLIKADSSVSVRDLRPVLQKLKTARITQIAFAVIEQKGG